MRYGLLTSTVTIGLISLILYVFIEPIATLFTRDSSAIENAVYLMRMTCPFYIFYAFGEVFAGGIKGRGNTFHPMIITLIGTCIFRVTWVQVVSKFSMSLKNIILGYPWSWFVTTIIFVLYYGIMVHLNKEKDRERVENQKGTEE